MDKPDNMACDDINTDRSSTQRKQVAKKYLIKKESGGISINLFNENDTRQTSIMTNTAGFAINKQSYDGVNLNLVTEGHGKNKKMRVTSYD